MTISKPDLAVAEDATAAMRHAMVASQLRTSAVSDQRVIAAMAEVARERFVPVESRALAYRDTLVALGGGRTMNTPLATGRLLTEARIRPGERVLLIGAAGGYGAAVVARLAAQVVALESDTALAAAARAALAGVGNVELVEGPLAEGWAAGAPYDLIVVDGAIEELPQAIAEQARPGGRLVTGLVDRGVMRLAAGERTTSGFGLLDFADIECAILPGFAKPRSFRF